MDTPTPALTADLVHKALKDLLDIIMDTRMFEELEAGCNGEGPVVTAYDALGIAYPRELQDFLDDGGDDDDE